MKKLFIIVMLLTGACQFSSAATKAEADKAYQENDFAAAIEQYEAILADGQESAAIYYNLGNSYYKSENIAKAILNYERALLLHPSDADTRFNLELAKSKTIDKVTPASEIFIVTWVKSITNMMSEAGWAKLGIISFILLLVGLLLYIFGKKVVVKKIGFVGALVMIIVCVCANFCADAQKEKQVVRTGAIIMAPSVTVRSTPNESGTELFVLHEGTKVVVEDNAMKGWKEIQLEDGNKGWVPTESIEVI